MRYSSIRLLIIKFIVAVVLSYTHLSSAQNYKLLQNERKTIIPVVDFELIRLGGYGGYHKRVEYYSNGTNVYQSWASKEIGFITMTYFPENSRWGYGINVVEFVFDKMDILYSPVAIYQSIVGVHAAYALHCGILSLSTAR